MSDHESQAGNETTNEDSKVDAIAAVALVVLAAVFCIYWVSVQ